MSRSWGEILSIMQSRRDHDSALVTRMIQVRDRYNGDIVIPLPDVVDSPDMAPLMPALVHDGIEATAMRAASVTPIIDVPPIDPAKPRGKRSVAYAGIRRRALAARWHDNAVQLKLRRLYRQLCGYGAAAAVVIPDPTDGHAVIQLRNALAAYPDPRDDDEFRCPSNIGFVYGRSTTWVTSHYPDAPLPDAASNDDLWDLVEWIDEDDIVIGVLGPRSLRPGADRTLGATELDRRPNLAGIVPAVAPRRVTLDRIAGQMQHILPMVDWGDRLMALEMIAAERAVFPDLAILGDNNQHAMIAGNEWHDGRSGQVNLVTGARGIQQLMSQPGAMTNQMIDRVERAARISGGNPAQFGGEFGGNVRSGRVLSELGALAIDPRIQELQDIAARVLTELNKAVIAVEKAYAGNRTFSVYSGWPGVEGIVEYTPNEHFENDTNLVTYPFPGTDLTQVTVALGQMTGAGLMSRSTARAKHPFIDDAHREGHLTQIEAIDDALLAALRQGAANGSIPPIDLAEIRERLAMGDSLVEAVQYAQNEAQERQAKVAEMPEPGETEYAAAPGAMPGLGPPGMGAEQQPPPNVPPPGEGLENLQQLMSALRTTARAPA